MPRAPSGRAQVNGANLPRPLSLWLLRVAWVTLPLTAGTAAAAATESWADGPRVAAATLLWLAWAVGLLATLAPRPQTLTALRVIAPALVIVAILAAIDGSPSTLATFGALVGTIVCSALASGHDIASAAANALAYGDEQRFPLRIPLPLLLGPLPVAVLLVGLGATSGPLLLADGRYAVGALATVVGLPVAALVVRALHPLACRWFVLVPAGIAIADPLTLTEPVLVRREHIASLRRTAVSALPADALDLRLGTLAGGIVIDLIDLSEPVEFARRRGRANAEVVTPRQLAVAVVRADAAIAQARTRRISA